MREDEEWSVSVVMDSTMLVTSDEYQRKIGDRVFQVRENSSLGKSTTFEPNPFTAGLDELNDIHMYMYVAVLTRACAVVSYIVCCCMLNYVLWLMCVGLLYKYDCQVYTHV